LAVLIVMSLPVILLFILSKIFPFWLDDEAGLPAEIED
jgi:hypothetical protein